MSKVLDTILELRSDMDTDWRPALEKINVYEDVKMLYAKKWTRPFCNSVLAYVVLAYDNQSGWIEMHKDRWDNKTKIASRLGMNVKEKKVKEIIENNDQTVIELVAWFIDYQTDWRWDAIFTCFEYASEMFRFAKKKSETKIFKNEEEGGTFVFEEQDIETLSKGNLVKAKNIEQAIEQRKRGEELLKEIEEEFVTLNTIVHKEGKRKPTDLKNIDSWETYIKELRGVE